MANLKHTVIPVNSEVKSGLDSLRKTLSNPLQKPMSYNELLVYMLEVVSEYDKLVKQ